MKMYSPVPPVCALRVACVASLISVTLAPTTAPPLGSITVPRMRPPVLCALTKGAAQPSASAKPTVSKILWQCNERMRLRNEFVFMTSPLAPRAFESHIFLVATPLQPYYNLANLEKVGCGVKQKESIQRIGEARLQPALAHQRSGAPRGHFFLRAASLGSSWAGNAAANAQPLPPV